MRITLFHNAYRIRGGEERTVDFEAGLLSDAGHDVHRFEVSNDATFGRLGLNAATAAVRAPWNRESHRAARAFLTRVRPDVSHVHNWFPLLSPSIYAAHRELGIPVVQTLHNYRLACAAGTLLRDGRVCEECLDGDLRPAIRHRCYRGSAVQTHVWCRVMGRGWSQGTFESMVDAYIAPSRVVADKHIERGLPADLMHVIPHACPDPLPGEPESSITSRLARSRAAVFLGRLMPEKGVDTLIEAWRRVDAPLRIVGTGSEEARLRAQAADLPNVEFLGELPHDQAMRELREAAVLMFPSRWHEPFGLGIIEAMACGTPVIATRMGAPAEIVVDQVTGLQVPPNDPIALGNAANCMINFDQHRIKMGLNGRRRYLARHRPIAHQRALLDLFTSLRANIEKRRVG